MDRSVPRPAQMRREDSDNTESGAHAPDRSIANAIPPASLRVPLTMESIMYLSRRKFENQQRLRQQIEQRVNVFDRDMVCIGTVSKLATSIGASKLTGYPMKSQRVGHYYAWVPADNGAKR
jgi:hypothetical protein